MAGNTLLAPRSRPAAPSTDPPVPPTASSATALPTFPVPLPPHCPSRQPQPPLSTRRASRANRGVRIHPSAANATTASVARRASFRRPDPFRSPPRSPSPRSTPPPRSRPRSLSHALSVSRPAARVIDDSDGHDDDDDDAFQSPPGTPARPRPPRRRQQPPSAPGCEGRGRGDECVARRHIPVIDMLDSQAQLDDGWEWPACTAAASAAGVASSPASRKSPGPLLDRRRPSAAAEAGPLPRPRDLPQQLPQHQSQALSTPPSSPGHRRRAATPVFARGRTESGPSVGPATQPPSPAPPPVASTSPILLRSPQPGRRRPSAEMATTTPAPAVVRKRRRQLQDQSESSDDDAEGVRRAAPSTPPRRAAKRPRVATPGRVLAGVAAIESGGVGPAALDEGEAALLRLTEALGALQRAWSCEVGRLVARVQELEAGGRPRCCCCSGGGGSASQCGGGTRVGGPASLAA
ncbi:hypothetical protein HK405_011028 [Cladochytrium tenue]|nr:hypothetical protein HK405_011028 [Cladochytrium tenue]